MEANSNNWQRRKSTFVKTEMRHFWWFLSTVRAMEQLITQQIWTFYQSKHQPRLLQRGCKPQTSSQITDYCGVQKRKREDVRQVRKSRFSSGLEKQKSFLLRRFVPVFILGAALLLGNVERWGEHSQIDEEGRRGKRREIDNSFFLLLQSWYLQFFSFQVAPKWRTFLIEDLFLHHPLPSPTLP